MFSLEERTSELVLKSCDDPALPERLNHALPGACSTIKRVSTYKLFDMIGYRALLSPNSIVGILNVAKTKKIEAAQKTFYKKGSIGMR